MKKTIFTGVIFSLALVSLLTGDEGKQASPADSITQAELRDHVYFLASDEIGGRSIGTTGYEIAAKYAASQFRASGLKPMFKDKNGNASYFQEVPLIKRKILAPHPLIIITPDGEYSFSVKENIRYANLISNKTFAGSLPIVFVGYGIEEADQGWNDLEGLNLEGKIAVMLADAPMRNGKPVLSDELHKKHTSIPGIVARVIQLAFKENGPKAIVVISNDVVDQAWQHIDNVLDQFTYALKIDVPDLLVSLAVDIIIIKRDIGKALFEGQVYNPIDSLDFDSEKYKCYELSGTDIKLELVYDEEDFVSWNVVGMVEGTNSELREQYITLGAHLDTVAKVKGQTVKGADDNASGSAGLIEIAEAVARSPFPRPMIFSLWTAEEGGAFGSQYFIQKPPVSLDNIKINVNLDMIGRSTPDNEETSTHLVEVFNTDIVAGLKKFIEEINSRTVKWPLLYVVNERLGGSSDHASFYKRNIPVIRFYSGHHDDVHLPSDDADKIDFEKMEKISKLTYWILKELAEADKIPDFEK